MTRNHVHTIGLDIGGTHIRIGLVTASGELLHFYKFPQRELLFSESPVQQLTDYILHYIRTLPFPPAALGIGLPATLSTDRSTVLSAPNLTQLDGAPLKSLFTQALNLPVFLIKDVEALFFHDRKALSLNTDAIVAACYIGTGIGNVISLGKKLLTGQNGCAGELGHIPVPDFDALCGCGNRGCAEVYCGGRYLAQLQQQHFPDTEMTELFTRHHTHPLLQAYIHRLALPIAAEINILDPGILLLGGGVVSMENFPFLQLEQCIRQHCRKPFPEQNLRVLQVTNDGKNGVMGAGIYAQSQIQEEVTA